MPTPDDTYLMQEPPLPDPDAVPDDPDSPGQPHEVHHGKPHRAYRHTEHPRPPAPSAPHFFLPSEPKRVLGKRLTEPTRNRDRDMLNAKLG